jgi:hypothetical protein
VVHELTGENRADVAEKIDFLGLGLAIKGNRENGEQAVQQNIAVLCMCVLALISPRASRRCLNGHPSAPKVMSCDVMTRSFPILFKKNGPD